VRRASCDNQQPHTPCVLLHSHVVLSGRAGVAGLLQVPLFASASETRRCLDAVLLLLLLLLLLCRCLQLTARRAPCVWVQA
jgi:hypothetical protein